MLKLFFELLRLIRIRKNINAISFTTLHNAGIIFIANRLPKLFSSLGYLNDEMSDFKDKESRLKAVYTIGNIINESNEAYNAHNLFLNRVLCGYMNPGPLPACKDVPGYDSKKIRQFMGKLRKECTLFKRKRMKDIQETYLQRTGYIEKTSDAWKLHIEPKPNDMMLTLLPWEYKTIKLPWMKNKIEVNWTCQYNLW